jgi:ribosomal protein L37AE/L43A
MMCAELIKLDARICKFCGYKFEEEVQREKEQRQRLLAEVDGNALRPLSELRMLEIAYDYEYYKADFPRATYYLQRLLREYPRGQYIKEANKRLAEMLAEQSIASLTADTEAASDAQKVCPMCSESIKTRANLCRHCGHRFSGTAPSDAT